MKKRKIPMNRSRNAIALSLALILLTSQGALAAGKTSVIIKKAGRATTFTPNTILSGSGVPAKTLGIDGDFYIDIKSANLYGPKTKGAWKLATSLRSVDTRDLSLPASGTDGAAGAKGATGDRGLTGASGSNGATGATGDRGLTGLTGASGSTGATGANGLKGDSGAAGAAGVTGLTGSAGAAGAAGITGAKGDTGDTGAAGITGAKGDTGDTGAAGITGAKGDTGLTGLTGTNGAAGLTGAAGTPGVKGDTGLTGSAGAAGGTGATGSAGISNAKSSAITFTGNLAGNAGSTKASELFGTFNAGKSYVVRILINTYDANSTVFTYGLGLALSASGDSPIISSVYSVIYGSIYSGGNRSTVAIVADVVLNGAATTNSYSLIATLTSGANGGASISVSGMSTQILVGSIS